MFPFTFPFGFNMLSICIIVWKDQMTMTIDNNEITSFAPDFGAIMRLARLLSLGHSSPTPNGVLASIIDRGDCPRTHSLFWSVQTLGAVTKPMVSRST